MRSTTQRGLRVLGLGIAASLVLAACGGDDGGDTASEGGGDGEVVIGLITKTDTNPFFVKMKEGAEAKAEELGAELQSFAGEFDGDNEAQVEAVEQLIAQGAQGILITPSDSAAIVPSLDKAREAGLLVVALDTQTDPPDAADVTFATDNFLAGQLIGQWAKRRSGTPRRGSRCSTSTPTRSRSTFSATKASSTGSVSTSVMRLRLATRVHRRSLATT